MSSKYGQNLKFMLDEFKIFNGSLDEINLDNLVINTINPHSYCVSKIDPLFLLH